MDAMRRTSPPLRDVLNANRTAVTRLQQLEIALPQFFHATGQSIAPFVELLVFEAFLGLDQGQVELVAEIKPAPAA